jgi:gliding motility-associated-like protein
VTYKQNSADAPVQTVSVANPSFEIVPASVNTMDTYDYSVVRVEDINGCVAVSLAGSKKATVYKVPVADAGEDKTVCGPVVTLTANPSVRNGLWRYSADALYAVQNNPAITITMDSSKFVNGRMNYRYLWEESNWQCKSEDFADVTFYRRVSNINAGADTVLYSFDQVFHLSNNPPESWETGEWTTLAGTGIISGNLITALSNGSNSFVWKIYNTVETCSASDILNIDVYNLEIPEGFSPNNDPEGYNNTFMIKGLDLANQQAELKIVNGAGTEVFSTSNINQVWNDWNGKNSQGVDLPEGTYYYLLRIISNNEGAETKVFKKSGFVILKRY